MDTANRVCEIQLMETNNIIRIAKNIEAKLSALEVGESCQHAAGFPNITRGAGQNRFTVAGDDFAQKASEAAFNAASAGLGD